MTLFTTGSIEIVNNQARLSDDELMRLQLALEKALEDAAEEVLARFGIEQDATPTISLTDFYQAE